MLKPGAKRPTTPSRPGSRRPPRGAPRAGILDWRIWRSGLHVFHLVECDDFTRRSAVSTAILPTSAGSTSSAISSTTSSKLQRHLGAAARLAHARTGAEGGLGDERRRECAAASSGRAGRVIEDLDWFRLWPRHWIEEGSRSSRSPFERRPRRRRSGCSPPTARILVGAGTVVRPEQVDIAVDAGARFVVTPGFSARVVERCRQLGVPVIPGVATPTEVIAALDEGLELLKFFPAEAAGGVDYLRSLQGAVPARPLDPHRRRECGERSLLPRPALRRRRRWELDGGAGADRRPRLRQHRAPGARGRRARRRVRNVRALADPPSRGVPLRPRRTRRDHAPLRPGRRTHPQRPHVPRLGRRRRVQRRARPAPLLRPAHGRRDRLCRQRGRPIARGPRPAGRRRHIADSVGSP